MVEQVVADCLEGPGFEVGAEFVGFAFLPEGDVDLLQQVAGAGSAGRQRADVGKHRALVIGELFDEVLGIGR